MKSPRRRGAVIGQSNIFDFAATVSSHVVQQESIDAAADTECKYSSIRVLLNFADDFHVVADVTISHEAHDANMALRIGWIHRRFDSFHHFGATATLARIEKRLRLAQILFGGAYRS